METRVVLITEGSGEVRASSHGYSVDPRENFLLISHGLVSQETFLDQQAVSLCWHLLNE